MKRTTSILAAAVLVVGVWGRSGWGETDARLLLSKDAGVAEGVALVLRAEGPAGLEKAKAVLPEGSTLLAKVAGQWEPVTGLYWYTNLEAAKRAAEKEGKPILSLRLLGRLDEALSCANSRFFRTTLYRDPGIAGYMKEHFILHWSSERPVPVVTVDFGDGRVIKTTVTGNSAHYLMSARGEVLDVLPGLYSPKGFEAALKGWTELVGRAEKEGDAGIVAWHREETKRLDAAWKKTTPPEELADRYWRDLAEGNVAAVRFAPEVEAALIRGRMAGGGGGRAVPAGRAGLRAVSKLALQAPMLDQLAALRESVATDELRNEQMLHREIHRWFEQTPRGNFAVTNLRVYSELFLTPRSDPNLGLVSAENLTLEK